MVLKKRGSFMKNKKALIVLCILLLFIPTYIAVFYYISAQNSPVDTRAVEKLELRDPSGNQYEIIRSNSKDDADFIAQMLSLNEGGKKQSALPDPL